MSLCCMIYLAKKLRIYILSGYQPRQDRAVQFCGQAWNRTEWYFQSTPRPLAGYPNSLLVILTCKSVNGSVISLNTQLTTCLSDIQDWKSFTLWWCRFSRWGHKDIVHCFGWKGCQYILYKLFLQSDTYITKDARPKIHHAVLMLKSRIGQTGCCH
jgi:hypothetical protein